MKVDLTKVKTKTIDGKIIKQQKGTELYKTIANILYVKCKNLDLVEIAMKINKGQVVEMNETQIKELRQLIIAPESGIFSFARKTLCDYLDKVEETEKKKKG